MTALLPPDPAQWQAVRADAVADRLSPAAHWYFASEWIALDSTLQRSTPFWLAAPLRLRQQQLQLAPLALQAPGSDDTIPLALVPPLSSNPVYVNHDTLLYLSQRPLRVRAEPIGEQLRARTLWPEDWRLDTDATPLLGDWRQLIGCGEAGAQQPFRCQALWQRASDQRSVPRWVLGFMLNGAQGDDDEAHAGHYALVLGRWREDGDIADWLVANFYNPDVVSEKGILPALVPMDNYLADLNSGQQQYRPSWLVACAFADETIASAVYTQLLATLERVYDHRLHYQHTDLNCTGLCMDALRAAGIRVPMGGPSSRLLAPILYASTLLRDRSPTEARKAIRYLLAEKTRLMPWLAFEASVTYLLSLLTGSAGDVVDNRTVVERALVNQATALYGMHFPQLPSARPWGREPAFSLFDYQNRVPKKRANWKIIPVPARAFPAALAGSDR